MKKKQRLSNSSQLQLVRIKIKSILILFVFISLINGCSYYKTRQLPTDSGNFDSQYNSIVKNDRYVIIHSGNKTWHLKNLVVNENAKEITALITTVDSSHTLFPLKPNKESRLYNKSKAKKTLEIHFYTDEILAQNANSQITIPFSKINKIEVYEPDTFRTILSVLGFTLAGLTLVAIIAAATKSSCPFLYIKEGDSFAFTGELYPGAILPTLERSDYIPLPNFKAYNNEYSLKITNELLEVQYTNLAQLLIINHSKDIEVLLDQNGKPHTFSHKENPTQVIVDDHLSDINPSLKKDNLSYLFDQENFGEKEWNNIVLKFDNTNQANQAKLILSAKNSLWLDLVYGKFNEQFGFYFNQFQKQQRKVPAEKNIKWRNEQGIPLSVFIKSNNQWVLIETINPVGPMAFRDLIIPIDLEKVNTKKLEIKLECGFMFWEVDYAAIDFSKDVPLETQHINPFSAIDEDGKDVTHLLNKEDNQYLVQPNIGNEVVLKYHTNPPKDGQLQSVFLKNKGYYEYIRNYKGIPNFIKLKTFREKGALSKYSKEEYSRFNEMNNLNEIVFNHE